MLPSWVSSCCCCCRPGGGQQLLPGPVTVLPSPPAFNPDEPVEVVLQPIHLITPGGAYVAPNYAQALADVQNYQAAYTAQGVGPQFHYVIRSWPGAVVLVQG